MAGFLDRLRSELVEDCHSKAHVTVLPPRPLICDSGDAWQTLLKQLQDVEPFRVELGQVEIFPVTQVIYLSVTTGYAELKRLHETLSAGLLAYEEPFVYHPHVTLAQDLEPAQVKAAYEKAQARWSGFSESHAFTVDRLTFVQNTLENRWTDLRGYPLTTHVAT